MTQLVGIPSEELSEWWPRVETMIERACSRSGLMKASDVLRSIQSKDWQLWVAVDGDVIACLVTEIRTYPQSKVCNFVIGTGRTREKWQHFRETIEMWARAQGCSRMRIEARTGWQRIFSDYKNTHNILEKSL